MKLKNMNSTKSISTRKIKNKSKSSKNKRTRRRMGGEVIGSGGFGCVFRPALKCKNKTQRKSNMVSKLLTIRHAKKEYAIIRKIKSKLQTIPYYEDYFLVDNISSCSLAPLSETDLSNFNKKCKTMKKHENITAETVNEELGKLRALNLPDGGFSLNVYYTNMKKKDDFKFINNEISQLLTDAIIPMNELGVYHADIKEANILFNMHTQRIGLIDWGLSFYLKSERAHIPKIIKNKPFQYNIPFSVILFNKIFDKSYSNFLKKHKNYQVTPEETIRFVEKYVDLWIEKRGKGHLDVIEEIWKIVADDEETDVLHTFIIPYISDILVKYTSGNKFQKDKYFHEVFLRNLDVWGLLMSYSTVLEDNRFNLKSAISDLYIDYLFNTSSEPIDISSVKEHLKHIAN